jgi:hypothetical protein
MFGYDSVSEQTSARLVSKSKETLMFIVVPTDAQISSEKLILTP